MSRMAGDAVVPARTGAGVGRLLDRKLERYPDTGMRTVYLAITVLATIVLYYELYIQGAVATKIIQHYNFTFTEFVFVLVIGNAVGAFASLGAGLADRWGRANLVVGGLLLTGLLIAFALPNASSKAEYTVFFALLSVVEGMALVATPALIRDFSPQLGRGLAMGFWTMGPVLGSLLVTEVSSHTLASHPDWQYQFRVCGIIGLIVWLVALVGLRELSPQLRDQLMVSIRDRALIEARAAGIDPEKLLKGHWRQMLRLRHHRPSARDQLVPAALLRVRRVPGGLLRDRLRLHRSEGQRPRQLVLDRQRDRTASPRACCLTGYGYASRS